MSPAFIVALVLGGIFALLLIFYLNSQYEKNKLERARRRFELADRQMRLSALSDGLPGQYLTASFKQVLHELELHFALELLKDDAGNKKIQARAEELRERIAQGVAYVVGNSEVKLHTEEQVKEVRFQIESLHTQLRRALEEGLLPVETGRKWLAYLQEQLVTLYLDFFYLSGQNYLQRGLPRQARLMFERAVNLIKKQNNLQPFKERLQTFQSLLEKTTAIVLEHDQQAASQSSELSEIINETEDDIWKKKQLYD